MADAVNSPNPQAVRDFLRQSHPALLVQGLLLYGLGAAIARYLGVSVRPAPYLAGQVIVLALQVGAHHLEGHFAAPRLTFEPEASNSKLGAKTFGRGSLYAAIGAYGCAAIVTSLLIATGELELTGSVIVILGALAGVAYSVPPVHLKHSGYGELLAAVSVSILIPTFAFLLQADQPHRLVFITAAPLTSFTFAALLIEQLTTYGRDAAHDRRGLMLRLGWETGMRAHDTAVLIGFAIQVTLLFLGFPRRVALGGLLGAPLGAALVWYVGKIREGAAPRWTALRLGSRGLVGLMTYLSLSGYLLS
ncbi:MAG: prenyltransferase [Anaerolineales bacterium]|nr:prenyltransferase [Anaerolineales bacterium]